MSILTIDRVVLYEILKWNFKLANSFMNTCKTINRQIHENNILMNKLAKHYQPLLQKKINVELSSLFFTEEKLYDELNAMNETIDNEISKSFSHRPKKNIFKSYKGKICNILIDKDKRHKDVVILIGKKNYILKTYSFAQVREKLNRNYKSTYELKNLSKKYYNSIGHHIKDNKKESPHIIISDEEMTMNLLDNFEILLKVAKTETTILSNSQSPSSFLKYFSFMIILLYIRYILKVF
jgi:hypothetical protein